MRRQFSPGLAATIIAVLIGMGSFYDLSSNQLKQYRLQVAAKALLDHLQLKPEYSFHQNVDLVRLFINENSVHRIDEQFYRYWKVPETLMDQMIEHASHNGPAPHMECSSRSGVMRIVLKALGIQTRAVALYRLEHDQWKSHSFLEALNPETKKWEIQDPDYNIYWIDAVSGKRAETIDLLKESRTKFLPCQTPKNCGWKKKNDEKMRINVLHDFFQIASIIDRELLLRNLHVNQHRLSNSSASKTTSVEDYCEYIPKNCRQKIYVYDNE